MGQEREISFAFTTHTAKSFTDQNKFTLHLQFIFFMFASLIFLTLTTLKDTKEFLQNLFLRDIFDFQLA